MDSVETRERELELELDDLRAENHALRTETERLQAVYEPETASNNDEDDAEDPDSDDKIISMRAEYWKACERENEKLRAENHALRTEIASVQGGGERGGERGGRG